MNKKIIYASAIVFAGITTFTVFTPAEAKTSEEKVVSEDSSNEVSIQQTRPSDPSTILDDGDWTGPTTLSDYDNRTDAAISGSASDIADTLIAEIPGVGTVTNVAQLLQDLNATTAYADQYTYIDLDTNQNSVRTATVTYYYSESVREDQYYVERTVSYGSISERIASDQ